MKRRISMYTVYCKKCGLPYQSTVNRSGVCQDCKKTRSQINTKYRDKTYDTVSFYVPKGMKKDIKDFIEPLGMSMNQFCNNAINMYSEYLAKEQEKEKKELE